MYWNTFECLELVVFEEVLAMGKNKDRGKTPSSCRSRPPVKSFPNGSYIGNDNQIHLPGDRCPPKKKVASST